MLKPINSDELLQVVRRAADKITEERQAGRRDREDEAGEKERREHAKSLFFSNLIEGRLSMAELLEKARSIGIELAASYYQIMLVKIGRSTFDSYSAAVNEMNDKLQIYIFKRNIWCVLTENRRAKLFSLWKNQKRRWKKMRRIWQIF